MASRRQAIQQKNIGEAPVQGAIRQKNMAAGNTNRRALDDIGNLVPVRGGAHGKQIPPVCRPVTRSYTAQLLAHSKADNNKTHLAGNANDNIGARPDKKPLTQRPIQKKAVTIKAEEKENAVEKRSKKIAPTLTSTLTARSMSACGTSNKPKPPQIVDIDEADAGNDLAVVEYVEEMYKFYKSVENEGRAFNYMDSQPEINEKMRAILIDWLVQVHYKFELSPETLYLTINIVDRFLASKPTLRRELQLVGMSAMLIASKYEEIWAPEVNDLVCISDRTYTNEQVLIMEKRILGELEWHLTVPTPYVFLVRFIKASMTDSDVENMAYFLGELGMMNYETLVYSPSKIAASAVYAARCTLNKTPLWNQTLQMHTAYSEQELMDCAKLLVSFHAGAGEQKLKGIYKKYCSTEKGVVAVLAPAKTLLA